MLALENQHLRYPELGVGIGAGSLIAFGKGVIDLAGHLTDLADQTGISAQTLSGMKSTLDEAGTSVDAFAKGIFAAQRNLGQITSESDQAARAAKRLGLDLTELRNASTEKFLDMVAGALGKVENALERNSLGAALMGRSFKELSPALSQIAGRLAELRAKGISEDDLKKLDAFGDAWTRAGNLMQIVAAGPLADLVSGIERLFGLSARGKLLDSLIRIQEEIDRIDQMLERRKTVREKGFGFFTAPESQDEEALAARRKLLEEMRAVDEQINKLNAGTARPTSAPFKGLPPTATKDTAGESFISSLRKQADQLRINIVELESGADAAKLFGLGLQFAEFKARQLAEGKTVPANIEQQFNDIAVELTDLAKQFETAKFTAERFAEVASMQDQDRSEWLNFKEDVDRLIIKPLEEAKAAWENMRLDELGAAFDLDSSAWATFAEDVQKLIIEPAQIEELANTIQMVEGLVQGAARGITDSMRSVAMGTQEASEAFRNLGVAILTSLTDAIIQLTIIEPLLRSVRAGISGGGGFFSFLSFLGTAHQGGMIPAYHTGGSVQRHAPARLALRSFQTGGEVPILAQAGEFMIKKSAVASIGAGNLDYMNRTGQMPRADAAPTTLEARVEILGDIIPRGIWTTKEDVVRITSKSIKDKSDVFVAMRNYGPGR